MRYGIKEEYWQKLLNLFASYPLIDAVILYGSRVKGTYKPFSDIDITFALILVAIRVKLF